MSSSPERMSTMDPKVLIIFDFDWTLFRSPGPPPRVPKKTFIHSAESLEPPYVPWFPGSKFWIEDVVRGFRAAQRRSDSVTALITARRSRTEPRILDLIEQKNLDPDFAFFRATSFQKDKDRVFFKRKRTLSLLEQYPTISKVIVWEDEQDQLDSIRDLAKRRRIKFKGNLVSEPGGLHVS